MGVRERTEEDWCLGFQLEYLRDDRALDGVWARLGVSGRAW